MLIEKCNIDQLKHCWFDDACINFPLFIIAFVISCLRKRRVLNSPSCNNPTPRYWPSELYVCTHKSSEYLRRTINPPKQNGLIRVSFNNIQYKIITSISTEHRKAYFEIFPEYVRMYFQSWMHPSLFYFMIAQFKDARKLCWHMYCLQRQITRFASKLLKITIEPI